MSRKMHHQRARHAATNSASPNGQAPAPGTRVRIAPREISPDHEIVQAFAVPK